VTCVLLSLTSDPNPMGPLSIPVLGFHPPMFWVGSASDETFALKFDLEF
jgi:hypothetical protein